MLECANHGQFSGDFLGIWTFYNSMTSLATAEEFVSIMWLINVSSLRKQLLYERIGRIPWAEKFVAIVYFFATHRKKMIVSLEFL